MTHNSYIIVINKLPHQRKRQRHQQVVFKTRETFIYFLSYKKILIFSNHLILQANHRVHQFCTRELLYEMRMVQQELSISLCILSHNRHRKHRAMDSLHKKSKLYAVPMAKSVCVAWILVSNWFKCLMVNCMCSLRLRLVKNRPMPYNDLEHRKSSQKWLIAINNRLARMPRSEARNWSWHVSKSCRNQPHRWHHHLANSQRCWWKRMFWKRHHNNGLFPPAHRRPSLWPVGKNYKSPLRIVDRKSSHRRVNCWQLDHKKWCTPLICNRYWPKHRLDKRFWSTRVPELNSS